MIHPIPYFRSLANMAVQAYLVALGNQSAGYVVTDQASLKKRFIEYCATPRYHRRRK